MIYVNGKKLGYFTNLDNISFIKSEYGQLIFILCKNLLIKNQFLCNTSFGLIFYYCSFSKVINNTLNNNYMGMNLRFSGYSEIVNNTCKSNRGTGIEMSTSVYMTVANNTIESNILGIGFSQVLFSNITQNYIIQNDRGIFISYNCELIEVSFNRFAKNVDYAVNIRGKINFIHHNSFFYNNKYSSSQAYDSGSGNYWYDTISLEGNYWSDWNQTNGYIIDGSAGSIDLYPLIDPPFL